MSRSIDELGIVSPRIDTAAHEHQFFSQSREFGIDRNGEGEVGHRAAFVNRHLVWKLTHHPQQKVCGIFVGGLGRGLAFRHLTQLVRRVIEPRRPCAQPQLKTELLLPLLRLLFASHQWILRPGHDWNVGMSDEFEHAQSVRHFFVKPLIARHHRDAENLSLWRLDQKQHGLLVRPGRSGCILIDDDLPPSLTPAGEA